MVLYSAVSSPLDRLKRFTLSSPGRPVHSDTVLGFSWKHSRWNEYFNKYNLKLNLKKTEVLVVSRTEKEAVETLDEYQLNQVTKFKYLGSITGSKGHIDEEINGRISKMSQNVGTIYLLLKDRHVPKKAKLLIGPTHDHSETNTIVRT